MLSRYLAAALRQARYEILPNDGAYYGEIPGLVGVWASAVTLEQCRDELAEVLEEWVLIGLRSNQPIPSIDGIELSVSEVA